MEILIKVWIKVQWTLNHVLLKKIVKCNRNFKDSETGQKVISMTIYIHWHFKTIFPSASDLLCMCPDMSPCPGAGQDPYSTEDVPEDLGYQLQMKDGIVHVYASQEDLEQQEPLGLPYPDLVSFAVDMSYVLAMIIDGPT